MIVLPENVRLGMPEDIDAIYELAAMAHAENGMAPINKDRVLEYISPIVNRRPGPIMGAIGVIDGPNGLEGSIGLLVTRWWYSDEWHIEDMWNFVHPDHRRSENAKKLLQFGKWAADAMHMKMIIGVLSTHRTEAKVRLYQRQFPQAGAFFLYGENALAETANGQ